jgi:hypothetical protein
MLWPVEHGAPDAFPVGPFCGRSPRGVFSVEGLHAAGSERWEFEWV